MLLLEMSQEIILLGEGIAEEYGICCFWFLAVFRDILLLENSYSPSLGRRG